MGTWIVGIILALIVVAIIWKLRKDKKQGKGCSCGSDCGSCGCGCHHDK